MKHLSYLIAVVWLAFATACTNRDYLNAVPAESTLLLSVNAAKMSGAGSETLFKTFLHVANLDQTGIDLSKPVVLFEDAQGNLGICAKTDDTGRLAALLQKMGATVQERQDCHFAALPNQWMIGYSDQSTLLMGPVLPAAQGEMMQLMARYLKAKADDGIVGTPMYDKLDSVGAAMSMVCQAKALPEYLVAPFTLGAPKDADPSQVLIAADLQVSDGCLWVNGKTFSFSKRVNQGLQKAQQTYRPIEGKYLAGMSQKDAAGLFVNVDGSQFVSLMTDNRGLQAMLSGINTAIDMTSIIRSVDGDMSVVFPSLGQQSFQVMMAAKLKHADWLADVDYWRQSVPAGGQIADWGRDCYYYRDGKTCYYFGVTDDWQYMSGISEQSALQSIREAADPLSTAIRQKLKGQRMAMVVNLSQMDAAGGAAAFLRPLFGNISTLVYTLKVD